MIPTNGKEFGVKAKEETAFSSVLKLLHKYPEKMVTFIASKSN